MDALNSTKEAHLRYEYTRPLINACIPDNDTIYNMHTCFLDNDYDNDDGLTQELL